jgi:hypothetical protein
MHEQYEVLVHLYVSIDPEWSIWFPPQSHKVPFLCTNDCIWRERNWNYKQSNTKKRTTKDHCLVAPSIKHPMHHHLPLIHLKVYWTLHFKHLIDLCHFSVACWWVKPLNHFMPAKTCLRSDGRNHPLITQYW